CIVVLMLLPPRPPLFPYTTLFRSPTSATAAVLLAAFQSYGLQPGPFLFVNSADLVWGLIASLYVGNLMLLVLNLPLVGLWVRLRSEEHTSELQSRENIVCRLLLEK